MRSVPSESQEQPLGNFGYATVYLLPGIAMVIHQGPVTFTHPRSGIARISLIVLTPGEAHPFGAIAIVIAIIFLVTFFSWEADP